MSHVDKSKHMDQGGPILYGIQIVGAPNISCSLIGVELRGCVILITMPKGDSWRLGPENEGFGTTSHPSSRFCAICQPPYSKAMVNILRNYVYLYQAVILTWGAGEGILIYQAPKKYFLKGYVYTGASALEEKGFLYHASEYLWSSDPPATT